MSQERRKVLFYLRPGLNASEQYADAKLEGHPLRDRNDMARTAMLAGIALGEVDSRLPPMLASLLSGDNSPEVIRKMLVSFLEISPEVREASEGNTSVSEDVKKPGVPKSRSAQNLANSLPD
ncbi:plasmid partitioning/stability family protein [Escherichia coli]|uniref:plasmid partitioning/stability family protein n=1 Tax=Escherichia coli TaxID=562 RepID=UPI00082835E9|nr:plasmid partitioning/stability family protein [Escherichia coli]EFA4272548.1 plasmid stabilization protein [Escherichia coli O8]HAN3136981.1 plasmid stabilization protein [Escherichia coli O25b:H4-ST131]EEY6239634.1 plasmid stabilization protein [Escherichia coli]EFA7487789.1 plasmid stabilization protein [Escherichia coli]EFA7747834.1 plasmid stabilization protein [Escherichia coli]